ncbi:MAG: ATP-grasp domain-containing protein, partial [Planctomycetaceae bacterium]|nr:ATP-grasp domain-containing protein [Planctomycetaceae bacterium]
HPGYGFLAENADFARAVSAAGLIFVGPPADAIAQMGSKIAAKRIAQKAGVPVVPGDEGDDQSDEGLIAAADAIGYPVMIKASAGGGGKGMRVAGNEISLRSGLQAASAEAEKAFKNAGVYLEKYIERPRHVEVQLLADSHGNVVHLWERDCSMQRRHQKLIEESPAPNLPQDVRQKICDSAVRLAKEAGYQNAGTCEFIVDKDNNFYFIEVNARIQVEHPVTEMVTGIDLIKQQILIAAGEPLPFRQEDIPCIGSAIELRVNAEDPENNFRGSPGKITKLRLPGGLGVRFDSHVYEGYTISPYYDSMIGKLIVHKPTREEAIQCMKRCLREFTIEGIQTTLPLAARMFNHSAFAAGQVDTTFVERTW